MHDDERTPCLRSARLQTLLECSDAIPPSVGDKQMSSLLFSDAVTAQIASIIFGVTTNADSTERLTHLLTLLTQGVFCSWNVDYSNQTKTRDSYHVLI